MQATSTCQWYWYCTWHLYLSDLCMQVTSTYKWHLYAISFYMQMTGMCKWQRFWHISDINMEMTYILPVTSICKWPLHPCNFYIQMIGICKWHRHEDYIYMQVTFMRKWGLNASDIYAGDFYMQVAFYASGLYTRETSLLQVKSICKWNLYARDSFMWITSTCEWSIYSNNTTRKWLMYASDLYVQVTSICLWHLYTSDVPVSPSYLQWH